jgi:hypothetical protein
MHDYTHTYIYKKALILFHIYAHIFVIIMNMIEVFLVKIILLCYLFQTKAASTAYDTTCVCTLVSPNGTFCWAYTCNTNQVVKCFSSDSTVEIKSTHI